MTRSPIQLLLLAAFLLAGCAAAPPARGADPAGSSGGYRGPRRDGHFPGEGLLVRWPAGGPPRRWVARDLGVGWSAPCATADGVFVTGMDKPQKRKAKEGVGRLTCLGLDGSVRWTRPCGREKAGSFPGPRATPQVSGGLVYCATGLADLACFDAATGERRWACNIWDDHGDGGGAKRLGWGYNESPLVLGDLVVVTTCSTREGTPPVVALDRRTGAVRWRADPLEGNLSAGDAGLVAFRHGGSDLLIAPLARGNLILDAATGELLWRFPGKGSRFTPVYRDGHLLVSGGKYALARWRLAPDGRGATRVWEKAQMRREDPPRATAPVLVAQVPPIVVGDRIYGVKHRHTDFETWSWWCCLDVATGETLRAWRAQGEGWPPPHPSFACAGGMFYLLENGPHCSLARPVADGMEVVSSFRPALRSNQVYTHPVIHAGRLYLRAGGAVACYDVRATATAGSAPAR